MTKGRQCGVPVGLVSLLPLRHTAPSLHFYNLLPSYIELCRLNWYAIMCQQKPRAAQTLKDSFYDSPIITAEQRSSFRLNDHDAIRNIFIVGKGATLMDPFLRSTIKTTFFAMGLVEFITLSKTAIALTTIPTTTCCGTPPYMYYESFTSSCSLT